MNCPHKYLCVKKQKIDDKDVLLIHIYRRNPIENQLAYISGGARYSPLLKNKITERDACPPPVPPPPPSPKDDRLFWGAMAVVLIAGGFAVYAKQTPEVRDWLTINAAWFDDLIAVLYQENMTYSEFATDYFKDLKVYIGNYFDDTPSKECMDGKEVVAISEGPKGKVVEAKDKEKLDGEVCDATSPPVKTKDICEIEACFRDLGDTILNNYMCARDACNWYNKLVQQKMENFEMTAFEELHKAKEERLELVKTSLENVKSATSKFDGMIRYFECGVKAPREAMDSTKLTLKDYEDKIKILSAEYQWANDKSIAVDLQCDKVEETVLLQYAHDVKCLHPGLSYDQKNPVFPGDPDLFLYHTYRYIHKLQDQMPDAVAGMTDRINRGLENLSQCENDVKARNIQIETLLKQKRAEMSKEFKKRCEDQKAANEKRLKDALKMQMDRHVENLHAKLLLKEKETLVKLNKMVATRVAAEKHAFEGQLQDMSVKLHIVEDKLNQRLKAERETRRSQQLWVAGAALLAATKKGGPVVRVDKELNAIEKASGDGDKLVMTVLKAIPPSVRTNGIVPESVLRERYHKMEKAALRVAMVEADGGPLPIYFISFVQSLFLFMKLSGIPQKEIDKPPQSPIENLDTFDLLQRARFWMERGNLALACRYVSSLQGASAAAAAKWYEAARSHLETRQAAEAVLAHAAALGLQYI